MIRQTCILQINQTSFYPAGIGLGALAIQSSCLISHSWMFANMPRHCQAIYIVLWSSIEQWYVERCGDKWLFVRHRAVGQRHYGQALVRAGAEYVEGSRLKERLPTNWDKFGYKRLLSVWNESLDLKNMCCATNHDHAAIIKAKRTCTTLLSFHPVLLILANFRKISMYFFIALLCLLYSLVTLNHLLNSSLTRLIHKLHTSQHQSYSYLDSFSCCVVGAVRQWCGHVHGPRPSTRRAATFCTRCRRGYYCLR